MGFKSTLDGKFAISVLLALVLFCFSLPAHAASYKLTILTSDQTGTAPVIDPNLQNPWGLAYRGTGAFWAGDNHTGVSTLYDGSGNPQSLIVTIPHAPGRKRGMPTGTVANTTADFAVLGHPALFLFAGQDGTISGWNMAAGSNAVLEVDNSATHASYTGLDVGNDGTENLIYAANFVGGTIDVFNGSFQRVTLSGTFTDPNLPAGYAPYNIVRFGKQLFVAYAKQNATKNIVFCIGCGFVDVFDLNGNFMKRFASQGTLNAPWGMTLSPAGFGTFSTDVLIANLGDGRINAFSTAGIFLGQLLDASTKPIAIPGLWAIKFGNGGMAGLKTELFFVSGPGGYAHGRFGKITAQ